MLHFLLLAVAILMAVGFVTTAGLGPLTTRKILYPAVLQASLIAALIALHTGRLRAASLIYLAGTWVWATLAVSAIGGIRSHALILYGTLPISAAWLLGYGAALWTAGVCIGSMLVFAILEMIGKPPPHTVEATALGCWYAAVQATLIGTIPVGHVIRRLVATLKELEEYKRDLERLVEQRTGELVKARDEAQAASRAKSVFLANMSHELRTPLNAILGFSSLLRERGASEEQRHDLAIINRSGEHLLALINDVLDVAKVEAGRTELEIAPCDLGRLVNDVADMIRAPAEQKGLAVHVESPPALPAVRTDAARLRQVLINLMNNAVKFTDRGSVTLRVAAASAGDGREIQLTFDIEDTGEGIAPGEHAAIFDAFVQASAVHRHEGVGLGLTISRQITELMGGTLEVESAPGKGSRFRLRIRVEAALASEIAPGPEPAGLAVLAEGQREYRVLIVEDQPENWMVLKRLLGYAGFQVRVAENGLEGVEQFREWHPHFIWMDLRMPVLDGVAAAARIRACPEGRDVRIVALSASGSADDRRGILERGFDDYLRKPCRPAEIFDCMARHLGVRYQAAPASREIDRDRVVADLAALSPELRNELREALLTLHPPRIAAVIARISGIDPGLGSVLARYARTSAYSSIFTALARADGEIRAGAVT